MEKFMKLKKYLWIFAATALSLGIAGCNIFNPTESVEIASDDAKALTYEGYIKFRNNEYTEAQNYFLRAIEADSTHSQAWYGLIKTKMNLQDINTFELLKYVNVSGGNKVPFAGMSDEVAYKYKTGIDTIVQYTQMFIYKDTTGQLDGEITYRNISDGYMILQMMQAMLVLRKTTQNLSSCSTVDEKGGMKCDMGEVLNSLKNDPEEAVEAFHEVFQACSDNPESMSGVFGDYLTGFDYIADDKRAGAIGTMCKAAATSTEKTDDPEELRKAIDMITSQTGNSNISDDDGDGCIDEEIFDGVDNDGDGEVDEDTRDKQNEIDYDEENNIKNGVMGLSEIKYLRMVKSAAPNKEYEMYDLDMNGIPGAEDTDEWEYVYKTFKDREANGDHRLKFALKLQWNPSGLTYEDYIKVKHEIAKDTDINNIKYDLDARKALVGGCWANYDEKMFMQWFEGRE